MTPEVVAGEAAGDRLDGVRPPLMGLSCPLFQVRNIGSTLPNFFPVAARSSGKPAAVYTHTTNASHQNNPNDRPRGVLPLYTRRSMLYVLSPLPSGNIALR